MCDSHDCPGSFPVSEGWHYATMAEKSFRSTHCTHMKIKGGDCIRIHADMGFVLAVNFCMLTFQMAHFVITVFTSPISNTGHLITKENTIQSGIIVWR